MKKLSALMLFALVMTVAPQGSLAEESFRTEVEFGYTYLEGDFGAKADIYRSAGRYHFMPVVTTGGPLAEAAFLARAGYAELFWSEADIDFGGMSADQDILGSKLLLREPGSPLSLGFSYSEEEQRMPGGPGGDIDETGFAVGYYLAENRYLELFYLHQEVEGSSSYTGESDQYHLSYKYVGKNSSGRFYNFEISLSHLEFVDKTPASWEGEDFAVAVAVDYFYDEKFSVGFGYMHESGDVVQFEGQEYSISTRYFIVPGFSVELEYSMFEAENSFIRSDEDEASLVLTGRF